MKPKIEEMVKEIGKNAEELGYIPRCHSDMYYMIYTRGEDRALVDSDGIICVRYDTEQGIRVSGRKEVTKNG